MDFPQGWWWDGGMETDVEGGGMVGIGVIAEALASVTRWRILRELSLGGFYTTSELAAAAGVKPTTASKHLTILRNAGLVRYGKARLYELGPGMLAEDGSRDVRLGLCTLHFGKAAGGA